MTLDDSGVIALQGGEGVGTVTRKGIGLPVGSSAINRTPRQTIESAVREAIGPNRGAQIEIFAPEGEERAQNLQLSPWHSWRHFDYRHHGYCHADVRRELEAFAVA